MSVPKSLRMFKEAGSAFFAGDAMVFGAAVAYYAALSLAPLLIIMIAVTGFMGTDAQNRLVGQLESLVGAKASQVVQIIIQSASADRKAGTISAIISAFTLLLSASGVFAQVQSALNRIWNVRARPGLGIRGWLRKRLLSAGMVVIIGLLIIASVVLSALLNIVFSGSGMAWKMLNVGVTWGVFTLLFAMIFKMLPDVKITWKDVWVGSIITTALFVIGKFAIDQYLRYSSAESAYGAAGSLIVLLIWFYYSALILFFGAELTQAYVRHFGSHIVPDQHAEYIR